MVRPTNLVAAIVVTLIPLAGQAQAQPAAISAQFNAILQAPQQRNAVMAAAKQSTTWVKHACTAAAFKPSPTIKVWSEPHFGADGAPLNGVWGQSVQASGCGMTRILNVATLVRSPGVLVSEVLAPGETRADPILQKDAAQYVFSAALAPRKGCRQAFIDDTKVVGEEPASSDTRLVGPVEVEHWTISACGQDVTVEVKFLPMAGQTDVVARAL